MPSERRRARRVLSLVFLSAFGLVFAFMSSPAHGADFALRIQVKEQFRDANGKADNQPVAGVSISVTDATGVEIGAAETDETGVVVIPVPEKADYTITLDESTLPEGAALDPGSPAVQTVTEDSFVTDTRIVVFFTGQSQSESQTFFERLSQRILDGVRLGLVLAMCAVGLSLIFGTTGLTNFAHGEVVTFGGLVVFVFNMAGLSFLGFLSFLPGVSEQGTFHILWAAPIGVAFGGLFGWALNAAIFSRLRRRGVGLVTQMVLTVGLSILLRNFFLSRFGGRTRPYREFTLQRSWEIGPASITPRDAVVSLLSLVILVSVAVVLRYTRLGKATRAVSDNPDLASATGIDSERVIRLVWIIGGALAAIGGVFRGLDEQVSFDMGGRLLFLMFAGITLGGLGSAFGALTGGFVVGIMVEVASLAVPTELKATPALLVLILVLLFRPQGILGKAQRVG
ncbi:MAG: branched-chain amino acid ABC transporter permease [Actinobacteria bacterium]|nr:branched-chain amino acid ABC transporter permease [Actinomycetota bacterium]